MGGGVGVGWGGGVVGVGWGGGGGGLVHVGPLWPTAYIVYLLLCCVENKEILNPVCR